MHPLQTLAECFSACGALRNCRSRTHAQPLRATQRATAIVPILSPAALSPCEVVAGSDSDPWNVDDSSAEAQRQIVLHLMFAAELADAAYRQPSSARKFEQAIDRFLDLVHHLRERALDARS